MKKEIKEIYNLDAVKSFIDDLSITKIYSSGGIL